MSEVRPGRDALGDERRAEIIKHLASVHELLIRAMPLSDVRAYTQGGQRLGGLAGMARDVDALRTAVREYGQGHEVPSDLFIPELSSLNDSTGVEAAPEEVVDESADIEVARLLLEQKADFSILAQMCAAICQRRKHNQKLGISMTRMQEWLGITNSNEFRASLERLESAGHVTLSHMKIDQDEDVVIKVSDSAIDAYLRQQRTSRRS